MQTTVTLIRNKKPTLVACSGGMSRSPAIVAAAIALVSEMPFDESLLKVAAAGPCDVAPGLLHDLVNLFSANGS